MTFAMIRPRTHAARIQRRDSYIVASKTSLIMRGADRHNGHEILSGRLGVLACLWEGRGGPRAHPRGSWRHARSPCLRRDCVDLAVSFSLRRATPSGVTPARWLQSERGIK